MENLMFGGQMNYEVEDNLNSGFRQKIEELLNISPSDAGASSKITKTEGGYHGVIEIFSSQGKFIAKTSAHNIEELAKTLFSSLHKQIKAWRKIRFLPQSDQVSV